MNAIVRFIIHQKIVKRRKEADQNIEIILILLIEFKANVANSTLYSSPVCLSLLKIYLIILLLLLSPRLN